MRNYLGGKEMFSIDEVNLCISFLEQKSVGEINRQRFEQMTGNSIYSEKRNYSFVRFKGQISRLKERETFSGIDVDVDAMI